MVLRPKTHGGIQKPWFVGSLCLCDLLRPENVLIPKIVRWPSLLAAGGILKATSTHDSWPRASRPVYTIFLRKPGANPGPQTLAGLEERPPLQLETVQYSQVQYSTVQYSTVQYSTVQYSIV